MSRIFNGGGSTSVGARPRGGRGQISPISLGDQEDQTYYSLQEPKKILLPLLVLLGVLVLTLLWWFSQPRDTTGVNLSVVSSLDNSPISGARVLLLVDGQEMAGSLSASGRVFFDNVPKKLVSFKVELDGFKKQEKIVDIKQASFVTLRLEPLELSLSKNKLVEIVSKPTQVQSSSFDFLNAEKASSESQVNDLGESVQEQLEKNGVYSFKGVTIQLVDVGSNSASIKISQGEKTLIPRTILTEGNEIEASGIVIKLLKLNDKRALFLLTEKLIDDSELFIDYPTSEKIISEPLLIVKGRVKSSKQPREVQVSFDGENWFKAQGGKDWSIQVIPPLNGQYSLLVRVIGFTGRIVESEPVKVIISPCKQLLYHGDSSQKIDVVFSPSSFSNVNELLDQVDSFTGSVFSLKPFSEEKNQNKLNVYYYPFNVECSILGDVGVESRLWNCDLDESYAAACPFADVSVVVINTDKYGGSGGNEIFLTKNNPQLFLHEFGHSFGLADRYCCDGYYVQKDPQPNLFNNRFECFNVAGRVFNNTCRSIDVKSGVANENWHEVFEDSVMQSLEREVYAPSDVWSIEYELSKYK
ncbi:hypothetical protein HUU53_01250 [Candidatus Micrarchaeota archaeon]|nr:hypothetical protein [Candidatus Micrarchaeota archaeon]